MGLSVLIPNQLPLWGSDSEDGQDSKMGMTVPKGLDTELSTSSLYARCGALMEANLERAARDQQGSYLASMVRDQRDRDMNDFLMILIGN